MQSTDIQANKPAASADATPPTQQNGAAAPASAPPAATTPQPEIDGGVYGFNEAVNDLVGELRKCAAYALGWRITMAIKLHGFRHDLGPDDWRQLLESRRLPFSARAAQTLARIGGHAVLADLRITQKLPPSITVLNEIAALPPSVVQQALAEGTIHSGTTMAEAKALVAEHRAKKAKVSEPTTPIRLL